MFFSLVNYPTDPFKQHSKWLTILKEYTADLDDTTYIPKYGVQKYISQYPLILYKIHTSLLADEKEQDGAFSAI